MAKKAVGGTGSELSRRGPSHIVVATAVLCSVLAAVWLVSEYRGLLAASSCLVALSALPYMTRNRRTFRFLCWTTATVFAAAAILGLFFGLYFFLSSGILIAFAPFVSTRGSPRRITAFIVALIVALATVVTWSATIYHTRLRAPDILIVHTTADFTWRPDARAILEGSGSGIGYGATGVTQRGPHGGTGAVLLVQFRGGMSSTDLQRLEEHIREVPGVIGVELCSRWSGDC